MKVRMIHSGEVVRENDSYGLRLIEQGRAVAACDAGAGDGETTAQTHGARRSTGKAEKGDA